MKTSKVVFIIVFFLLFFSGCKNENKMVNELENIGVATMLEDGTIALKLKAETGSAVGHAYFEYKPDDPQYKEIKEHIGEIHRGEEKLVPPWPDEN